jgi:hypothetical protein
MSLATVVLRSRGTSDATATYTDYEVHALLMGVTYPERAASGVVTSALGRRRIHIKALDVTSAGAVKVKVGDLILDPDGVTWLVQQAVLLTMGSRWACDCEEYPA